MDVTDGTGIGAPSGTQTSTRPAPAASNAHRLWLRTAFFAGSAAPLLGGVNGRLGHTSQGHRAAAAVLAAIGVIAPCPECGRDFF